MCRGLTTIRVVNVERVSWWGKTGHVETGEGLNKYRHGDKLQSRTSW